MADERTCDACHKLIRTRHVELAGFCYHADCFRCDECNSKLDENQATKGPKGKLMCAACAEAQCKRCHKNIVLGQKVRHVGLDQTVKFADTIAIIAILVLVERIGSAQRQGTVKHVSEWACKITKKRPYWHSSVAKRSHDTCSRPLRCFTQNAFGALHHENARQFRVTSG
jgi:hypothetical protein